MSDQQPFVTTLSHAAADPFRLLVEAVKDYGLFMLDPAGHVTSWNPGAEKSKGYKAEEIIGRHVSCFYTPEDVAAGQPTCGLRIALDQGQFEEEGLRVRKNGETFWAVVTITSIRDSFGQHIGFANVTRDITERKRAEAGLQLRDRAIESLVQGLCITDPTRPDNPIIFVNDSFSRITGYARGDVVGQNCRLLQGPGTDPEAVARIRSAIRDGHPCLVELLNYRKDGTPFWNGLTVSPIRGTADRVTHFVGVLTDISPLKLLEQQFRQSQKMEAVGQLAGGVAHDFNNLLTIISGYSELLLEMLPPGDPKREAVQGISEAGERAAGLTRQLLSFSRQAVLEIKVLDLNDVVRDTEKLLHRVLGEDVVLASVLDPGLSRVRADPGQLGQVLMNLAVNARDAMPQGGHLTVETSDVELDEAHTARHPSCQPGRYVRLVVTDTGTGMSLDVRAHIFEPFFTTKGPGKGTGLGLATVYGIVTQSGGSIDLYTEPGHGTAFKIYLPAVTEKDRPPATDAREPAPASGTETVLVVEDEDAVRAIAVFALRTRGYTVLQADRGKKAVRIADAHPGRIDLLVTDVVMPGMSGRELADTLSARHPDLGVLYVSGYTDDAVVRHGILRAEIAFLQKPYTPVSLARKVRDVLDTFRVPAPGPPDSAV